MASRPPQIEEVNDEFDDDFDLPLPQRLMPSSTNTSGGSSGLASSRLQHTPGVPHPVQRVTDAALFKSWTCVYPIYIDAKRPYGTGRRRIAREKSCWWPYSQLIVNAAVRLQLRTFHEPEKTHPRDWENPGRVKIQIKDNGRYLNRNITTKKQLLEALAIAIQQLDPSQTPLPEQIKPSHGPLSSIARSDVPVPPPSSAAKGKSGSKSTNKAVSTPTPNAQPPKPKPSRTRVPKPPQPLPPLSERYNPNSPAIESGVLVDTVKVALKQQEKAALEASSSAAGGQGAGLGKGKRKVVRVRG